jgi:hypothetical protein
MPFRVLVGTLSLLLVTGCAQQGLYRWVPFVGHGNRPKAAKVTASKAGPFGPITGPVAYGVEVRVQVNPPVVRLAETRTLEVRLVLINRRRSSVTLFFNDSRRYDIVLRDAAGKKLVQWSDDQPAHPDPGTVIINPDERAEFVGTVSTRDMVAGRTYTLETQVVGYPQMRQFVSVAAGP